MTLTIGLKSTMQFFMKRQNFKVWFSLSLSLSETLILCMHLSFSLRSVAIECREQFLLVLASFYLSLDGLSLAWYWRHMDSLCSSGLNEIFIILIKCKCLALLIFYLLIYHPLFFFCSGFWPTLAVFLQRIPVLGWLFQQPYVRSVCLVWKSTKFCVLLINCLPDMHACNLLIC